MDKYIHSGEIIGNKYIHTSKYGKTDIFEIVDKVPSDYMIWNIGSNMGNDELIPFIKVINKYTVSNDKKLCVRVSPLAAKKLNKACSWGIHNYKKAVRTLKRNEYNGMKYLLASEVVNILENITIL